MVRSAFPEIGIREKLGEVRAGSSSKPHSSASHQSSAVLEEVTSTIGMSIPLHLTRSMRSLQFPSASASSVAITVFSRAELSRLKLLLRYSVPTASRVRALPCPGQPWLPGSWWTRNLLFLLVCRSALISKAAWFQIIPVTSDWP
jgi:hypothetical protein